MDPAYDAMPDLASTTPFSLETFRERCRNGPVLDVGCGYGRITRLLHEAGYQVVGVDTSVVQLRRAHDSRAGLVLVQGSVTNLPFESNSFGAAVAFGVIDSLVTEADLRRSLREVARTLHYGAFVFLNFYTKGDSEHLRRRYKRGLSSGLGSNCFVSNSGLTVRHWELDEVVDLAEGRLVCVEQARGDFWSMHHKRRVPGCSAILQNVSS